MVTGVIAKNIITWDYIPSAPLGISGTTLSVVAAGTPEVVSELYVPSLVKYGSTDVELGTVDLKTTDGDVVLKNAWFEISGLNATEINQINALKLFENGTQIGSLIKSGDMVYASNINRTLNATSKTYSVVASINAINNSTSAITSTPTVKLKATDCETEYTVFESTYGATGINCTNVTGKLDMSSTIKFVNEVPTITAINGYVNGGDVVYKVTLNSTKLTQLTGIKLVVSPTNLSGYPAYAAANNVFVAADAANYQTQNYLTGTAIGSLTSAITALTTDVNLNGTVDVYIVFKGLADLGPDNVQGDKKVRIELVDITYADNYDTGKTTNVGMLSSYKAAMAGSLLLSSTIVM